MTEIHTIVINRGPSGGGGGGGSAVAAGTGITVTGTDPRVIAADFGTGAGKVLEATQTAIGLALAGLTGIVRASAGALTAAGLSKEEIEAALGPLASGFVRSAGGVLSAAGLSKAEVEASLGLTTAGVVRSTAGTGALFVDGVLKGDLAAGGVAGDRLEIAPGGTTMQWTTPTVYAPSGAQYITLATDGGLSAERTLAATDGLTLTDGGANGAATLRWGAAFGDLTSGAVVNTLTNVGTITTGAATRIGIGSSPSALIGRIGFPTTSVAIGFRNQANNGDVAAMSMNSGNFLFLGADASGNNNPPQTRLFATSNVDFIINTATALSVNTSQVVWYKNLCMFYEGLTGDVVWFTQAKNSDVACSDTYVRGQGPFGTATGTNRKPGDVIIESRTPSNGGTTRGRVVLRVDTSDVLAADKDTAGVIRLRINTPTQTTVGAAGGASALPATPTKYIKITDVTGTDYVIPAYTP